MDQTVVVVGTGFAGLAAAHEAAKAGSQVVLTEKAPKSTQAAMAAHR
ncbi:MAG: FAD-dependent oxidoreductase [Eggerthella lenta]